MTKTRKNRNIHNKTKKHVFTKKDYNSGDGMLTTVWGPPMWHFLHTMSFNYPVEPTPEDKKNYKDFIYSLRYVLPCKYCRMNLKTNFKQLPLKMSDMKNRESFSRYVYELHGLYQRFVHVYVFKRSKISRSINTYQFSHASRFTNLERLQYPYSTKRNWHHVY